MRWILTMSMALLLWSCGPGQKNRKEEDQILVMHAGSLSVPFREIARAFEEENPGIRVVLESGGSVANARKVMELDRECDVFASADYVVIDEMLIPDHASWNLPFATNEMVIAFTPDSRAADRIGPNNWYKVLAKPEIRYGRSDPDSDPCGYRTVMCLRLSDIYYQISISQELLKKDLGYMRPKEVDLLALLETGSIDFIFIYRSVAVQHGLKYLELPDKVNLENPGLPDYYNKVWVDIRGKKPGETKRLTGEPMLYSLTIPKRAVHSDLAMRFVEFVVRHDKGLAIMKANGQDPAIPSATKSFEQLPANLKEKARPFPAH